MTNAAFLTRGFARAYGERWDGVAGEPKATTQLAASLLNQSA